MTKAIIHLSKQPKRYAPMISSRRLGLRRFQNVAYKSDGDDDGDDETKALMAKINERITVATRGMVNQEAVSNAITLALKDLPLEALRSFNPAKVDESVTKLAAAVEKLQNSPLVTGVSTEQRSAIKKMLADEKTLQLIERSFQTGGAPVVLNTRAAATMTTANTLPTETVPDDILHSFSIEAFEKKRRPVEYIYDIASRRTVAKVTEYKTWLEEGTEDGAFAIIAEGAVKPLMSKTLVRNQSEYFKVAGKRVYNEEFQKFRTEAYNIIEDLINDQVKRNYAAILTTKLIAAAAAYVGTALDGLYANPTDYHAIGAVAAQLESLEFQPDLLIINPQDKWRIALSQDANGAFYISVPTNGAQGVLNMLGLRVLSTNRMAVGEFMLGESGLFKIEDEPLQVRMGFGINVTKDGGGNVTDVTHDFDTNRFRIIVETFAHAWISTANAGSFVKTTFATVKAAIDTTP